MRARIIGLGQAAAGDDAVGLAVLEWLQDHGVPEGVELVRAAEESALIGLLETAAAVVLVDAVLGTPPGQIRELTPAQLDRGGLLPLSTHGMGVPQALQLAHILTPDAVSSSIRIVAVTISRPGRYEQQLSPAVAAAVPRAGERVLALVAG